MPTASPTTPTARSSCVSEKRDIINLLGDPAARQGARPRREGGAASARPADLQHRVRDPDQPARHLRRDDARAAGRDHQREGGVLLPLLAAEEPLPVPALRRPRAGRPAGASSGRASRPGCDSRTARKKPAYEAYRFPIVVRKSGAARSRSGAACVPARARATSSCSAGHGGGYVQRRRARSPPTPSATSRSTKSSGQLPLPGIRRRPAGGNRIRCDAARHEPHGDADQVEPCGAEGESLAYRSCLPLRGRRALSLVPAAGMAPRRQWSMFEDHTALVRSGLRPAREAGYGRVAELGAGHDPDRGALEQGRAEPESPSEAAAVQLAPATTSAPNGYPGFGRTTTDRAPQPTRWASA